MPDLAPATPLNNLLDFAAAVWSDVRLPGEMRADLSALYYNNSVPILRQSIPATPAQIVMRIERVND